MDLAFKVAFEKKDLQNGSFQKQTLILNWIMELNLVVAFSVGAWCTTDNF